MDPGCGDGSSPPIVLRTHDRRPVGCPVTLSPCVARVGRGGRARQQRPRGRPCSPSSLSAPPPPPRPWPRYSVSPGASYWVGYRPGRGQTRNGFPDQVVATTARRGQRLRLVNFGCGGATTTSIQIGTICPLAAVHSPGYGGLSQAGAAEAFLRAHVCQVALITVSIGGNYPTKIVRVSA